MIVIETQILNGGKKKRMVANKEIPSEEFEFTNLIKKDHIILRLKEHHKQLIKMLEDMPDSDFEKNLL